MMVHMVLRWSHIELHIAIISTAVRLWIPEHFRWRWNERITFRRMANHAAISAGASNHAVVVVML